MRISGQCVVTFLFCYVTLGIELPYALVFSLIDVFLDLGKHRRGPIYIPSRVTHEPYSAVIVATVAAYAITMLLRMFRLLELPLIEVLLLGAYVGLKHWILDLATVPGAYLNGKLRYLTVLSDGSHKSQPWLSTTACIIASLLIFLKMSNLPLVPVRLSILIILLALSLEPELYLIGILVWWIIMTILSIVFHMYL